MVDVVKINPGDTMPSEAEDFIQVVRRFDTDPPQATVIDIDVFVASTRERRSLADELGPPAAGDLDDAVRRAVDAAESKDIDTVYVADLTASGHASR